MEDGDAIFGLAQRFAASANLVHASFDPCLREILSDAHSWLAVAECERQVVGYCLGFDRWCLSIHGRAAWLDEIMVKPLWRRRGVGRELLTAFEGWARARCSRTVGLGTREAWPFFEAMGYEEQSCLLQKAL